jgi:hypothetical protein
VWARADEVEGGQYGRRTHPSLSEFYGDAETTSTDTGEFVLVGLHPRGRYTVRARDGALTRQLTARGVAAGASGIELACGTSAEDSGSITLVVMAGDRGQRASRFYAKVFERAEDGGWKELHSATSDDGSGLATIARLRSGAPYDVLVSADGLGCAYAEGVVTDSEGVALKLTLPAPATLSIQVTSAGLEPRWPVVVAEREQGAQERRIHRHGQHAARGLESGRVELRDLEPGRYTLRVSQGGRRAVERVELTPGESRSMSIELP